MDWLLHVDGSLLKTGEDTFTVDNGGVTLSVEVVRPEGFKYEIYKDPGTQAPTLKVSPKEKVNQTVFLVVLHPARAGEAHPTITEIEEDGRLGIVIQHRSQERKIIFNFKRPKINDRIFNLMGETEPRNTYNFTRNLPPLGKE